jgi:hypothetical protein
MTYTKNSNELAMMFRPVARHRNRFKALAQISASLALGLSLTNHTANANNHWPLGNRHSENLVLVPSTYTVVAPTSYSVVLPTVTSSYVVTSTVDLLPTSWYTPIPFIENPCGISGVAQPALQPTRVPELQEIPLLPKVETESPPETKSVESKPATEPEPKLAIPETKSNEPSAASPPVVPMNTSTVPAKPPVEELKPPLVPSEAKPPVTESPKESAPRVNEVPVNEPVAPPALKPSQAPVTAPAKPAEDPLVPPPATEIPLPNENVPPLIPAQDQLKPVTPTSSTSTKLPEVNDKSIDELQPLKPSDLPPPVENDLPKLPDKSDKPVLPQIPLPDIPPPAEDLTPLPPLSDAKTSQPVPVLPEKTPGKPIDTNAVKVSEEKSEESSVTKRDSFKPIISDTAKLSSSLPKLSLTVRNQVSGAKENGVTVMFREPGANQIKFRTETDSTGVATLEIPEGRWEVLVEMPAGPFYVLGELVSEKGQVKTVTGRLLPTLEINR